MFDLTIVRSSAGPKFATYSFTTPQGQVQLTDIGHQDVGIGGYNGVTITYNGNEWLFMYNGKGDLTLLFDDEGQLSAQSNGNVVPIQVNHPHPHHPHPPTSGTAAPEPSEAPE